MEYSECEIKGVFLIKPTVFSDSRGYFFESFNRRRFDFLEEGTEFVQDNQSLSHKGVIRGLHFQIPPHAQGKLVSVIKGAVWDVAVDIRLNSPTYGKFVAYELNENNKWQLYIPPGFAHGFLTLENNTIFSYKCTGYYHKDSEQCILWNDPTIAIPWNENTPIISDKDKNGVLFSDFLSKFAIK